MKVIIPVAGIGSRLRPHTYTQPKPLIPVAGKPILAAIIDQLLLYPEIEEIVLVIGYLGDKIKDFVIANYPNQKFAFVHQAERLGLGHAVWSAKETFASEKSVLIVLGDIIFEANLRLFMNAPASCLGIKKVEDPRRFGVVELDEAQKVKRLVEKPRIPKSNLALVGVYKIDEIQLFISSLTHIIDQNIRTREEFQLTDALMHMIEQGAIFQTQAIESWFDCGKKEILLETNAVLLKRLYNNQSPTYLKSYDNTILIPPVSVGKNCKISDSVIGPNVSIGDNTQILRCVVRDSIIGNFSTLSETVLDKSIIGNDAAIRGMSQSFNIGDNTEIDLKG